MPRASEATIIDGRAIAAGLRESVAQRVSELRSSGRPVRLDALIIGGNGAGEVYAANQARTCGKLGIDYQLHVLGPDTSQAQMLDAIEQRNTDGACTGVMVHLPLPDALDTIAVQSSIAVHKDVEGVNPANIGGVIYGQRTLVPCTAAAVMHLIESTGVDLQGANVVVVGASDIVGKPVAVLAMQAEATVVSTNIHTDDLEGHCRQADVLIAAAGVPGLITDAHVRPGAIVIDVGINRVVDQETGVERTVGDVDFDAVKSIAGHVSPVPGGVGPVTVAMLLRNTLEAAARV
ncbi:MAG: bifunctional 5,10-methylenetetrahydrofolate dehydrogenase/5,10-methenyltetrahydrofolate cyclohydrolase [Phycisphaerales bacterium]|nr:bifunctional 5,10-methylenetetrahydrofolate dehydrogenase/5,10-methenyltetrahydrofolate cyclohydrolase [Phycisphaerales bacterium]